VSDPWEDEGFGGEDDWAASESLETDLENTDDDVELEELGGEYDDEEKDDDS
jgi:hypothetical protein